MLLLRRSAPRPGRCGSSALSMLLAAALTIGGIAACRGDGPTAPEIESITLARVPTSAMRVGGTAQLAATAISSSGSAVNDAPVTWRSSDQAVATVSASGVVTAVAAGQATVTASSGRGTASAEILVVAPLVLTAGTTASLPGGALSLTVVPGLDGIATLLVGPDAASLADDKVVPGTIYQIASEFGVTGFFQGVTLSLRYDAARLPAGATAAGLQLYVRSGSSWVAVDGSTSDEAKRTVTGKFLSTGTYAVRYTPIDRVAIFGAPMNGALAVGQTARLEVRAYATGGDTLPKRTASWSTSAPAVVAVDDQGTITGVSAGIATITATIEGASATAQVQVRERPPTSEPVTLDWTTDGGNNQRTGYVDVTLDPATFARKWEVTLSPTGFLNEAATGYGNVYVSARQQVEAQGLWALDAATGAVRWAHAFVERSSIHGPATGNGRVYVAADGREGSFLWSFDAADGTVKFNSAYTNQGMRLQAPAVTPDAVFLAGSYYGGMSAFATLDGSVLWRRPLPLGGSWTPAASDGKVYAFGDDRGARGLLALDGFTGSATLVASNLGLPDAATPVLGGADDVYGIRDRRLFAINLARNVVAWNIPGAYEGVPSVDGSTVYAVLDGKVEARRRTDGVHSWTWVPETGMVATGSLVVTRNLVFVHLIPRFLSPDPGRILALDLATRKVVWSYDADGAMVLGNGLLIVTSRRGGKVTAIVVR